MFGHDNGTPSWTELKAHHRLRKNHPRYLLLINQPGDYYTENLVRIDPCDEVRDASVDGGAADGRAGAGRVRNDSHDDAVLHDGAARIAGADADAAGQRTRADILGAQRQAQVEHGGGALVPVDDADLDLLQAGGGGRQHAGAGLAPASQDGHARGNGILGGQGGRLDPLVPAEGRLDADLERENETFRTVPSVLLLLLAGQLELHSTHNGDIVGQGLSRETGMDDCGGDSQALTLRSKDDRVQNADDDLQAAGRGRLGDALARGEGTVVADDHAGAQGGGGSQEDPLDDADLGELAREGVHSTDNPSGGLGWGEGGRRVNGC